MLLKFARKELTLHRKINLLVLFQLTVVFTVSIICVSIITWQLQFYTGFKENLNQDGFLVDGAEFSDPVSGVPFPNSETIESYMKSVHIFTTYFSDAAYHMEGYPLKLHTKAMDTAIAENYQPQLKSGRWINTGDIQTSLIEAVVTANEYGLKTGDEFKTWNPYSDSLTPSGEPQELTVKIVGELAPKAQFFGSSIPPEQDLDYRMCFQTADPDMPYLLVLKKDMDNAYNQINALEGLMMQEGSAFVVYDPSITEEEQSFNEAYLRRSPVASLEKLTTIDMNSRNYLKEQLAQYLPLMIGLFLLTLTSEVTTRTISARLNLRNYAVYRLCGSSMEQCFLINLTSSAIVAAAALLVSVGSIFLALKFNVLSHTVIKIGYWQLFICLIIFLIDVVFTSLLPRSIISKMTLLEMERAGHS